MAKDYVDGNFSIVLHKDENNKTLVVFADGKAIQLFSNGKVFNIYVLNCQKIFKKKSKQKVKYLYM